MKLMTMAMDMDMERRHRAVNRGYSRIKGNITILYYFVFLLPAVIGIGFESDMILSRRNMCSIISSSAWKETSQPCFCWRTEKHRRLLRTYKSAKNSIDNDAKLQSPKFYQRLNSPKNILAPMVAQSDLPFRLMCEQLFNVDLSYTQMIHAYNFVKPGCETFRTNHLDVYPHSIIRDIILGKQDGNKLIVTASQTFAMKGLDRYEIDEARARVLGAIAKRKRVQVVSAASIDTKPTIVQIAAHDPDVAVQAAMAILERSGTMCSLNTADACTVAGIDLNLGCPQTIARKGRYGSFLHDEHPDLTYKVLKKLRSDLPSHIGVTAKIRLPPTQADADAGRLGSTPSLKSGPQTIDERMRCLIDCGVDLITIHGRTRFENKVAVGMADWESVRQCVEAARSYSGDATFPIFSNGGIEFGDDVQTCFDRTSASGVMSSEGLLELPNLFQSGTEDFTAKRLLEQQLGFAELYLDYATIFPPLPGSLGTKGGSFNVIRSHLFKFLHRYLEENPDLRSLLGKQDVNTIKQSRDLVSELRSRYSNMDEEQIRNKKSWDSNSSWYRRHRATDSQIISASQLSLDERKQIMRSRLRKMKV